MKKIKIPTLLGILVITLGLSFSIILVNQRQLFSPRAKSQNPPKNIQISNITNSSVTITWTTQDRSECFVIWGKNKNSLDKTAIEETEPNSYTHSVTINNLEPGITYYFKINSGNNLYDKNGLPWEFKTATQLGSSGTSRALNVSGSIINTLGSPVSSALVFVKIEGGSLLSTVSSENGNWIIPLSQLRTERLDGFLNINGEEIVEIIIDAGPQGSAKAQIYAKDANKTPIMTLGEEYDFKNINLDQEDVSLASEIEAPEEIDKQPKFDIDNYEIPTNSYSVSIDSIKDGEVIYTTKPEFFGRGIPEEEITIVVESENPQTEDILVGEDGRWRWSPPSSLTPGKHKVTLTYRDEDGILRSIVRNFVVQAAEANEPAFESTPSANLTPSPFASTRPSPNSIATSATTVKNTASPSSIPQKYDSGIKTPTLVLLGTGLILFIISGFILLAN
jgi:hypothetical protein